MDFNATIKISESVFTREVDGELILLDLKTEEYYGLDAVGHDIWKLFKDGKTLRQTHDTMLEMYDVNPEVIESDLKKLASKLIEKGLVEICENS